MKTMVILISCFIICCFVYGYFSEDASPVIQGLEAKIETLTIEKTRLAKTLAATETVRQKRIELDYLWPIHVEDWIPGPSKLTSPFGKRDKAEAGGLSDGYHEGVDMWGVNHSTHTWEARIVAVAEGWIEHFLNDPIKGEWYLLHHDDGNKSEYHHVSVGYVLDGERVYQGQVLARMGNTGISTGPHLHFQLEVDGKLVNALKYIQIPKE